MTARKCFIGKMGAGKVSRQAGELLLEMLDDFTDAHRATLGETAAAQKAAGEVQTIFEADAARMADERRLSLIAQANVLRAVLAYDTKVTELRETPGDLGFGNKAPPTLGKDTQTTVGFALRSLLARDVFEIASWNNVHALATTLRGEAHRVFAESIEYLRPKMLGLKAEAARELEVLRAAYGRQDVDPQARAVSESWFRVNDKTAGDYIEAGGVLFKRDRYFPNFDIDHNKVRAMGAEEWKARARAAQDRDATIDFATGERMSDARFEQLLDEATQSIIAGGAEGLPSAGVKGRPMLAHQRDAARFFVWKDAETWMQMAEDFGTNASPFQAMINHIDSITRDTAMIRILGPNPQATLRFMVDVLAREPGRLAQTTDGGGTKAALKQNRAIEARVRTERRLTEDLFAEVSGANRIPVNTTLAQRAADVRHWLSSAQLGSALISSFTDPGLVLMASRFNGLPAMNVVSRAVSMMGEKGSEVFAAQQGLVMDSLAHAAGQVDRFMGETVRMGVAAKLSSANIRASGLRRWTGVWRAAFGLEMMAHAARQRGIDFADLDDTFREAMSRYGIDAADWEIIRAATPHEPRENALFTRPADIAEGGTAEHRAASEKFARMMQTEMDYAVIEGDPITRAMMLGSSQPGSAGGEVRRSVSMYRGFPGAFITMHMARAFARGWDGSRLGHAGLTFATMVAFGTVAMQSKEILAGRQPLSMDPTTPNGLRAFGKAMIQSGGLGVFGDVMFVDQTRYGNTWAATIAGPVAGSVETVLGDFLFKNIQKAGKGEQTTFAGDALYAAGRHLPGSSLWWGRRAFQGAVLDQLARAVDERAPERFARIEEQARREWGQEHWWRRGEAMPSRAPDLSTIGGAR